MEPDTRLQIIEDEIIKLQILIRTNNLLLSRFILELDNVKKDLGIPKRQTFFRFEILDDEYNDLVSEFGKPNVDKALYKLDRLLLLNKQSCPNNIARYIRRKLIKKESRDSEKRHE